MHANAAFVLKAFEAGALGYVTKSSDTSELIRAVEIVAHGGRALSDDTHAVAAERLSADRLPTDELSPRETEILRLVASGRTTEEIADLLSNQRQDGAELPLPDQIEDRRTDREN